MSRGSWGKPSAEDLAGFFRRLQTLMCSGIPIHGCLHALSRHEGPRLAEATEFLLEKVSTGSRLSQGIRARGDIFPALAFHLIDSGERSGRLDRALISLADYLERSLRLQRRVQAAFVYPAMLLLLTAALVVFMAVVVVPQEREMLVGLGTDLPWLTRAVLLGAELFTNRIVLAVAVLLLLAGILAWPWMGQLYRERLAPVVDGWLVRVPVLGRILRKTASARVLEALASLLEAGTTFGGATESLGGLFGNLDLEERYLDFHERIRDGQDMGTAAESTQVFPVPAAQLFRVAQEQGRLAPLMRQCAQLYEDDVQMSLITLVALMEPLAMAFMGLVVGTVVIAMTLPTITMVQNL